MDPKELAAAVAAKFNERRIRFLLTGGLAVNVHARPRATQDADFIAFVRPDEVGELVSAVEDAGLVVGRRADAIRKLRALKPVKVGVRGRFHVDLRLASQSLDHESLARSMPIVFDGERVMPVPPEELVAYKLARFDDQDRADITSIVEVKGGAFDWNRLSSAALSLADETAKPVILDRLREIRDRFMPSARGSLGGAAWTGWSRRRRVK